MAMFDSIKDSFNKGVAAVSVKSETLVESSRIKTAISNNKKKWDGEIGALGTKLYHRWKAGEAIDPAFAEDFARIGSIEKEIDELNARLEQLKTEETKLLGSAPAVCAKCGKPLVSGARFCTGCGAPVNPAE